MRQSESGSSITFVVAVWLHINAIAALFPVALPSLSSVGNSLMDIC